MSDMQIRDRLSRVSADRLRADLFALAADPLPYRKLNYTLPGHAQSTLDEADDYLAARLESCGYTVEREPVPVQAVRCDMSKTKQTWYSPALPDDPWYTAHNLYAECRGTVLPDEIILLCAHKDTQSWVDSPGAYDNGVGTVALLELARLLAEVDVRRTVRFLWCNEEHTPWTSIAAANHARERGDNLIAVLNTDGPGGRSMADHAAGRRTNVTAWTEEPGRLVAELACEVNTAYGIGLEQSVVKQEHVGNDDGSFIKAGYLNAVNNIGSWPYQHDWYHDERDTPDQVDYVNLAMTTQLVLGLILRLDRDGAPG